jgi:hypothetical protein
MNIDMHSFFRRPCVAPTYSSTKHSNFRKIQVGLIRINRVTEYF